MPSRYSFTKIKKRPDGKRVFRPTMYPTIPIKDSDIFIYPKFGDRLDNLAFQFYGDPSLWWYIAKANDLNSMNVPAGKSLRIPSSAEGAIGG